MTYDRLSDLVRVQVNMIEQDIRKALFNAWAGIRSGAENKKLPKQ